MDQSPGPNGVKRILVYGVTGSGKTTFARKLSEASGIPWHSVDDLTWEPGWVGVPAEIQEARIKEICARPEWILDTAYASWLDIPLSSAELIIGLDYSRLLSLWRLSRRTMARLFDRRPICNGNRETLRSLFSKESIILWHFRSYSRKRARMRGWASEADGPDVILFKRPRQVEAWLGKLRSGDEPDPNLVGAAAETNSW